MTARKLLAAALAAGLLTGAAATAEAKLKRITIGSNPAGSVYFLLAGGFAKHFQQDLKIRSTAQPHAGSSVYLPLMNKGEIVMGLNSSLDSGLAVAAKGRFTQKIRNVRLLARVWILPYAYMVKENSGIKTLDDLRGKKVIVNVKTNVSLAMTNQTVLATAGMSEKDVNPVDSGGVVVGINMVVEGRADAAPVALAMPAMRKAHATVPGGLRILGLGKMANDEMLAKGIAGLYSMKVKPSKRYAFVREPLTIGAFDTYLNAGSQVGHDDAYLLVKSLHTNWKKLQKDYAPLRGTPVNGLAPANTSMPYHPGAIKYYKEAGLWTAGHDAGQTRAMNAVK